MYASMSHLSVLENALESWLTTYLLAPVPGTPYTTRSYSKGDNGGKDFGRYFKHWKQFFRLLGAGFLRFLISAGLIAALYELIWWYSSFALLNTSQKRMFNFLVTALSLALGLNLASSLKSIAIKSRWWILSWEKRPLEDVGQSFDDYCIVINIV